MADSLSKVLEGYRPGYALPGAVYKDPAFYELEVRHIMLKAWHYAGHRSMVPERGDYFLFEIAGESVIVVRDGEGAVNAFMNVCRHRGSRICDASTGRESRFTCRYHGWTYGLDGSLKAAARMPAGTDRSKLGLRRLQAREFEGLIFVNFDDDPPDFGVLLDFPARSIAPWPRASGRVGRAKRGGMLTRSDGTRTEGSPAQRAREPAGWRDGPRGRTLSRFPVWLARRRVPHPGFPLPRIHGRVTRTCASLSRGE